MTSYCSETMDNNLWCKMEYPCMRDGLKRVKESMKLRNIKNINYDWKNLEVEIEWLKMLAKSINDVRMKDIIENYRVMQHKSGIIEVVVSTYSQFVSYHWYGGDKFAFDGVYVDLPMVGNALGKNESSLYNMSSSTCKGQIYFFFTPVNLFD